MRGALHGPVPCCAPPGAGAWALLYHILETHLSPFGPAPLRGRHLFRQAPPSLALGFTRWTHYTTFAGPMLHSGLRAEDVRQLFRRAGILYHTFHRALKKAVWPILTQKMRAGAPLPAWRSSLHANARHAPAAGTAHGAAAGHRMPQTATPIPRRGACGAGPQAAPQGEREEERALCRLQTFLKQLALPLLSAAGL